MVNLNFKTSYLENKHQSRKKENKLIRIHSDYFKKGFFGILILSSLFLAALLKF